jgi:hypothetical protein
LVAAEVLFWKITGQAQGDDVDAETAQGLPGTTLDIQDSDQEMLGINMGVASLQ